MKEAYIYAGNYGSGKTELSLNTALDLAQYGPTALCDLDIVNPYFRSAEHGDLMKENSIRLIAPPFANTAVDVPALSAEVRSAFEYDYAVFDAGGDPVGASAIGTYHDSFEKIRSVLHFYYVINARRPFQSTAEEAAEMLRQIEANARLTIDGLVNNTNLARESTPEDLRYGQERCEEISRLTGIPVVFASGTQENIDGFVRSGYDGQTRVLRIFTRPAWLDGTADEDGSSK